MNIGFFSGLFMAFDAALDIGTRKSTKSPFHQSYPSLKGPCLFTGFVRDPNNPYSHGSNHPLSLDLYVDDFIYFLEDPKVKELFCHLLSERCKVNFMGIIEWFLGIHFSWCISLSLVLVHLNQSGFALNLVESKAHDPNPLATPYWSGIPVDFIAPSMDANNSPAQTRRMQAYQSLIGSIGWPAMATCPDLTAIHSFLSSYNAKTISWPHKVGTLRITLHPFHLQLWYQFHLQRYGAYAFLHPLSTINQH
jgi:hypothetical protein